jgi:ABC-type sugar transport system substrate-binding protein
MGVALERPSRLGADIPPAAEETLMRALEPEPEKRTQTVSEFRQQLDRKREEHRQDEADMSKVKKTTVSPGEEDADIETHGANGMNGLAEAVPSDHGNKDARRRNRNIAIFVLVIAAISGLVIVLLSVNKQPAQPVGAAEAGMNDLADATAAATTALSAEEATVLQGMNVALSVPTLNADWYESPAEDMRNAADAYGVKLTVESAGMSAAQQAQDIEMFAAQGFDALLVVPVDSESLAEVLRDAWDKGIIVIMIDRYPEGWAHTAIIRDYTGLGTMAADWAADNGAEAVIEITGNTADSASVQISEGFATEYAKRYPAGKITTGFDSQRAEEVIQGVFQTGTVFDTVFCHDSASAIDVAGVLTAAGYDLSEYNIIGISVDRNALQAVQGGVIDCVVSNTPRYGEAAFGAIARIINYGTVDSPIVIQGLIIDGSNVGQQLEYAY